MVSAKDNKGIPVQISPPQITVPTDSSLISWGAVCNDIKTGGQWGLSEIPTDNNINYLELKAVYLGLLSFRGELLNKHVRVQTDNSTTVAYINHMGGTRYDSCNSIARKLWELAKQCNMWLTAVHIPGRDNVADRESRIFHDNTEWMLRDDIFQKCIKHFSLMVEVDLFASRLNKKLKNYMSWKPDPGALHVDAFKVSWSDFKCYGFAPFSLIDGVLQKLLADKVEGIFILPHWPTQPWFPQAIKVCVSCPVRLPRAIDLLTLPYAPGRIHPLYPNLRLIACHLSGKFINGPAYQIHQRFPSL